MFTPMTLRGITLKNRVICSPMATYMAKDGVPNDFHLVHLSARNGWRSHGGNGDDVCLAGCAHYARLPRNVE